MSDVFCYENLSKVTYLNDVHRQMVVCVNLFDLMTEWDLNRYDAGSHRPPSFPRAHAPSFPERFLVMTSR